MFFYTVWRSGFKLRKLGITGKMMVTNQPVSLECRELNRIEPRPVHNAFQ